MKPLKLKRYLITRHTISKEHNFFVLKATTGTHVTHHIAKCKKAHTIAEDLILPTAIDMAKEVLDQSAVDELKTILLSNNTIQGRISRNV